MRIRRAALAGCVTTALALAGASAVPVGVASAGTTQAERLAYAAAATAANPPMSAAAIATGATATDLALAIASDPSVVVNASFTARPPLGTPTGVADSGSSIGGFPTSGSTYAILSTGNAAAAPGSSGTFASTNNGGGNVRGNTDYDVTILRVKVAVPANANCLTVGMFKFLSEEYPTFVGSTYNDAFTAELGTSTWTTSGSVITQGPNFAFDETGDVVSINSTGATGMSGANAAGSVYGGATANLQANTPIGPGQHDLFFSIFDQGDQIYDSAVFLDSLELKSVTPGSCPTGAFAPLVTSKTADASVTGTGNVNGYTIRIANPNNRPVQLNSIHDDLPAGFTYRNGTTTGVTTFNPSISGQRLTWNGPFTVPANGFVTLHFNVNVSLTPGVYLNNAGGEAGAVKVTSALNTAAVTVQAGTLIQASPAVAEIDGTVTARLYNLRAVLTVATTGAPLGGSRVDFHTLNGSFLCFGITNGAGEATCNAVARAVDITLSRGYRASFAGTPIYLGSTDTAPLTVVLGTPLP